MGDVAEMLIGLLVILLILGVIALAIYGLCVLVGKVARRGRRRGKDRRPCVFCERMTPRGRDRCDWCGRDLGSPLAEELSDIEALERQLRRFGKRGTLKAAVVDSLLGRVRRYRRELLRPSAPPRSPFVAPPPVRVPREEPVLAEVVEEPVEVKPARPAAPAGTPRPAPPRPRPVSAAAAAAPQPVVAPRPESRPRVAPPPRRSWGETLAAFMEERNIRWGELIGGLLIVGSSLALVLSLWDTLKGIPYFSFLISVAVSVAIFGVGLYAHHRWKLESTSRGLLVIATLLVPLNFLLAMAGSSGEQGTALALLVQLAALGVFAWLVGLAGQVLVPGGRWLQVLAVLGNSAAVLVVARWIDAQSADWRFVVAGCGAVACFAVAVGGYVHRLSDRKRLDATRAAALFTLIGTAAFALAVALGLLVARSADVAVALQRLSVPIALAAMPILAGGLATAHGTGRDASLAAYHTAGTSVALAGMVAMLVALGLAWPQPLGIIAVGGLNCAALGFAAFYWRLPALHAGAIASAALLYLTGLHVALGDLPWFSGGEDLATRMLRAIVSAKSGTGLAGLFVLFGLAAEGLARRGRHRHGAMYAGGCGVVAVAGLVLVSVHGWLSGGADALRATSLYAVYGLGSLGLTARWRRAELSYLGLGLLLAAPMWVLWGRTHHVGPPWAAVLGAEALLAGGIAAVLHHCFGREAGRPWQITASASGSGELVDVFRIPLLHVCEIVAPAALSLAVATAWFDRATIDRSPWPVLAAACLAICYLLLAWGYRSPRRTWVGSTIVLAGLIHLLNFNYTGLVAHSWPVAILAHCTLAVAAGLGLDQWSRRRGNGGLVEAVGRVFGEPLGDAALLCSGLAVPALAVEWAANWAAAGCLLWLAAIWLVISWRKREAAPFAAGQIALALAVLVATAAWLQNQPWVGSAPHNLFLHPRSLHAYGIALGLLSLAWMGIRIAWPADAAARKLLNPRGPSVDRFVRHAVVLFQFLLIGWHLLPGFAQELLPQLPAPTMVQLAAGGTGAWMLLGVMAAVVVATLWYRWKISMISSLVLAATIPWLVAGGFALPAHQAVASALRWGAAVCFVVCSAAIWGRKHLLQWSVQARMNVDTGSWGPRAARATLLATTAAPVLALTLAAALIQLGGVSPAGPAADSFFDRLGTNASYLVPLALVMLGLVGYAVRERSAGYAFSAGLVAELIVTLGYALYVTTTGDKRFSTAEFVALIQLATITAAVWAGAWLAVRQWLDIWREGPSPTVSRPRSARVLMDLQLGMGVAGNALLLIAALLTLILFHQFGPRWQAWTVAAGSPWGWMAAASVAAAYFYRAIQQGRRPRPDVVGLVGVAALGLLACTIQGHWPEWGYRVLMLGWAAYAMFIVSVTWWVATVRTLPDAQGPPQAVIRAAAVWVGIAGMLAVVLGLKAAVLHKPWEDVLWAAAAIAVASAAGATMAVWRRQESWAFAAALGVNLAASLVVWYFHRQQTAFSQWWPRLVQANVISSSAVALVWLAARRRLYRLRELTLGQSPLLAAQTAIAVLGNVSLLVMPVIVLLLAPVSLPDWMARLAEVPGWLGLLLAAVAVGWYFRQVFAGNLLHVLAGLGLGAGVLLACYAANFNDGLVLRNWLEYHTLTTAWAAVGLIVLAVGMAGRNLRLPAWETGRPSPAPSAGPPALPDPLVRAWITAIGSLVLALAVIHSARDPASPWWSARAILAVSLMAGILALWQRRPAYVYVSGLLLNVIGVIAWMAWDQSRTLAGLAQANVLCLAVGSAVWSLLGRVHPAGVPHVEFDGRPLPFAHLAARLAVGLLAVVVGVGVAAAALGRRDLQLDVQPQDWLALVTTAAAVTICLWDRRSRFALPGLYALGLLTSGMGLCARDLDPHAFCGTAAVELSGFVLGTTILAGLLPRLSGTWRALGVPEGDRRWAARWFPAAVAAVAGPVVVLSVWISIDSAFAETRRIAHPVFGWLSGQMAGPTAAVLLLPAAILLAALGTNRWREKWQYGGLGLGLVIFSELGFVWLVPEQAPWLHRSVIVMVAAVMMTLVAGLGLRRMLPGTSDWIAAGRRITPVFGGLAIAMLALVLVQEGLLFDRVEGTPMAWPAVAVVAVALAALAATCLAFAVRPDWDPLALGDRGRTAYVYAAEVLLALIGLHVWFTMPWLFTRGLIRRFWMLIVMAVAFGGAGLSELFQRRKMPVLSEPLERTALLLPLVPAVGFWFMGDPTSALGLIGRTPVLWFLIGLFYGALGVTKRSLGLAGLSIFTGNVGLWVLWHQQKLDFYHHPQLWLIPVALAVLVAEHLDRRRLSHAQRTAIRYLVLSVIYVSSTTEFMRGIGGKTMLPLALVLILLSVIGALAGVLLRVRSFLYLGFTFLMVVIVRMIVYAAFEQKQIWIFWTCCILLGIAIIALFAFFEKRRNDILTAMERFKDWET